MSIEPLESAHWPEVQDIYAAGIATGNATFETEPPEWTGWDNTHLGQHRFVALDADRNVTGWVAAAPVSDRCAYAGVVEHSVYVHPEHQGRGIASTLLAALIDSTGAAGIKTIQTGIVPET